MQTVIIILILLLVLCSILNMCLFAMLCRSNTAVEASIKIFDDRLQEFYKESCSRIEEIRRVRNETISIIQNSYDEKV